MKPNGNGREVLQDISSDDFLKTLNLFCSSNSNRMGSC